MILCNDIIELRPYVLEINNDELKLIYLKWLSNYTNIELVNSFELLAMSDINFIDNSFRRFTASNAQGYFIYHKVEKKYIGTAKLDKIDLFRRSAEFGVMIGEVSFRGQKVGSQAMNLILEYGFDILGLHRIWGGTSELNNGMIRLFNKFGFKEEGRFREANYINGVYSDNIYFGLLRNERK